MMSSFPCSPVPCSGAERISDSASELSSLPDTPAVRTAIIVEDGGSYKVRDISVGDYKRPWGTASDRGGLQVTTGDYR